MTRTGTAAAAVALSLAFAALPATGEDASCESMEELARITMELRQAGASLRQVMRAGDGNEFTDSMTMEAYRHPAYRGEEYQQRAINEFANRYYLACLDARAESAKAR